MSGKKAKQNRREQNDTNGGFPESLPEMNNPAGQMARQMFERREMTISHEGPLPPPEMLLRYEKIIPNAPERLLALVEKEQEHRHQKEKEITAALIHDTKMVRVSEKRGDIIALIIFVFCMGAGLYILENGHSVLLAASLMGAPIVTAIGNFLLRRKQ